MQTVKVRTTQNVSLEYPLAGLGDRMLAWVIDTVIKVAYAILLVAVSANIYELPRLVAFLAFLPVLLYHLLFEIFMDGQSPGKRQMSIQVIRLDGTSPTLGNYLLRWILRTIDMPFFFVPIAIVVIALSSKGQRLGDMAAGTTVVKLSRAAAEGIFTWAANDYKPVYMEVTRLSDGDIEIIQQALQVNRTTGNIQPVLAVTSQIESMLGVKSDMPPVKFLYTIIRDYSHLAGR